MNHEASFAAGWNLGLQPQRKCYLSPAGSQSLAPLSVPSTALQFAACEGFSSL